MNLVFVTVVLASLAVALGWNASVAAAAMVGLRPSEKTAAATVQKRSVATASEMLDEDYDDFAEVPKFLRYAYDLPESMTKDDNKFVEVFMPPRKRYRKYLIRVTS